MSHILILLPCVNPTLAGKQQIIANIFKTSLRNICGKMSFLKTNVSDCLILSQQYHNHHFYQILPFVDAVINSEGPMHAAPSIIHNKTISQPLQVKIPAKTPDMQFPTNESDDVSII